MPGSAELVPEVGRFIASLKAPLRALGGSGGEPPWPGSGRRRKRARTPPRKKVQIAEGLWVKCDSCKEIVYRAEVDRAGRVCPRCQLSLPHLRPRAHRAPPRRRLLRGARRRPHLARPAGVQGHQALHRPRQGRAQQVHRPRGGGDHRHRPHRRLPVVLAVFEFGFMGGSMGSVVGEKLTRAIELALAEARRRSSSSPPRAARACRRASSRSCRWPRPRPRSQRLGRGARALHLAPHRSDHRRRDRELRHAGRRHPRRAARAHRLRGPARDRGDHPPAAARRASSARSSCSSTASSTWSSSAASCARRSAASSPSSRRAPAAGSMTYREAVARLLALRGGEMAGMRPGLERIQALLDAVGNPEQAVRASSRSAAPTARAPSRPCSPPSSGRGPPRRPLHLAAPRSFRERIRVDGRPHRRGRRRGRRGRPRHARRAARRHRLRGDHRARPRPLRRARRRGGGAGGGPRRPARRHHGGQARGGRADPHRLRPPGLLGDTLARIAPGKAAIIRSGVAVSARQDPEAEAVIARARRRGRACRCSSKGATCASPPRGFTLDGAAARPGRARTGASTTWRCALLGVYQPSNALLAAAAARRAGGGEAAIRRGPARGALAGALPGLPPRPAVILDGAHNPAGARALAASLRAYFPGRPVTFVIGVLADKDAGGILAALLPLAARVILTAPRTRAPPRPRRSGPCCPAGARVDAARSPQDALAMAIAEEPAGDRVRGRLPLADRRGPGRRGRRAGYAFRGRSPLLAWGPCGRCGLPSARCPALAGCSRGARMAPPRGPALGAGSPGAPRRPGVGAAGRGHGPRGRRGSHRDGRPDPAGGRRHRPAHRGRQRGDHPGPDPAARRPRRAQSRYRRGGGPGQGGLLRRAGPPGRRAHRLQPQDRHRGGLQGLRLLGALLPSLGRADGPHRRERLRAAARRLHHLRGRRPALVVPVRLGHRRPQRHRLRARRLVLGEGHPGDPVVAVLRGGPAARAPVGLPLPGVRPVLAQGVLREGPVLLGDRRQPGPHGHPRRLQPARHRARDRLPLRAVPRAPRRAGRLRRRASSCATIRSWSRTAAGPPSVTTGRSPRACRSRSTPTSPATISSSATTATGWRIAPTSAPRRTCSSPSTGTPGAWSAT